MKVIQFLLNRPPREVLFTQNNLSLIIPNNYAEQNKSIVLPLADNNIEVPLSFNEKCVILPVYADKSNTVLLGELLGIDTDVYSSINNMSAKQFEISFDSLIASDNIIELSNVVHKEISNLILMSNICSTNSFDVSLSTCKPIQTRNVSDIISMSECEMIDLETKKTHFYAKSKIDSFSNFNTVILLTKEALPYAIVSTISSNSLIHLVKSYPIPMLVQNNITSLSSSFSGDLQKTITLTFSINDIISYISSSEEMFFEQFSPTPFGNIDGTSDVASNSFISFQTTGASCFNSDNDNTQITSTDNISMGLETHTVSFFDGDTEITGSPVIVNHGQTIQDAITSGNISTSKSGYTFVGWFSDSEFTDEITTNTIVRDNMTLYAKYEAFTISFATSPWADIVAIADSGQASSVFSVGDTRDLGTGYHLTILGFNHDTLSNSTDKAAMSIQISNDFGFVYLPISTYQMASACTYTGSHVVKTATEQFFADTTKVPSEIAQSAKSVTKKAYCGTDGMATLDVNIIPLAVREVFPTTNITNYPASVSKEGDQYAYYIANAPITSTTAKYYFRSIGSYNRSNCHIWLNNTGVHGSYSNSFRSNSMPLVFCI